MNKKISIFSDLHLGVHQHSSAWHQIALDWCDWYVDLLKENDIDDVIFTGDFFHHRSEISVNTLHVGALLLDKLKDFNLYMIPGNHCAYYKNSVDVNSLNIFKDKHNIKVFNEPTYLNVCNRKLGFIPWGCNVDNIEKSDILFGHFELQSFKMNTYKVCEHGQSPQELLSRSSLIFSGHFHLREEREYDDGTIIYVGNPFEMDFSDAGHDKGIYILDIDKLEYNFIINNKSPKHSKLMLSELVTSDLDNIKPMVDNKFVKIVLDKNISNDHLEKVLVFLKSFKPININTDTLAKFSIGDNLITDKDFSAIDIEQAINEFVGLLDINNKKEVLDYTTTLYQQSK